jgi:hypothetical protein
MKTGVNASILTCIVTFCAVPAAMAQTGPAGYWKGDDGTVPTNAVDSSGNGNNGTYQSGATTSPSVPTLTFPNASSFSFTTTGAIVSAPGFSWPTGGPVTVAYWNNVTTAQVRNSSAFNVGNTDQPNRFHAHSPWSDSVLYWDYGDIGTTGRISASYATYLNKWTHVALVSEGVGGAFRAIYFDGVLAASMTSSDGPKVPLTGVGIGRWPGPNLDHAGLIDDFRIYNRVLSAAQIQALAMGQTEPSAPTGLTAATGAAYGEIQLNWSATPSATSYILRRGTAPGGPYTTSIPVSGTSYLDTGLGNNTVYYYVVAAVATLGTGPNSAEASGITRALPPRTQKIGNENDPCGCGSIPPVPDLKFLILALTAAGAVLLRRR